jgi:hypothetical protein
LGSTKSLINVPTNVIGRYGGAQGGFRRASRFAIGCPEVYHELRWIIPCATALQVDFDCAA